MSPRLGQAKETPLQAADSSERRVVRKVSLSPCVAPLRQTYRRLRKAFLHQQRKRLEGALTLTCKALVMLHF